MDVSCIAQQHRCRKPDGKHEMKRLTGIEGQLDTGDGRLVYRVHCRRSKPWIEASTCDGCDGRTVKEPACLGCMWYLRYASDSRLMGDIDAAQT